MTRVRCDRCGRLQPAADPRCSGCGRKLRPARGDEDGPGRRRAGPPAVSWPFVAAVAAGGVVTLGLFGVVLYTGLHVVRAAAGTAAGPDAGPAPAVELLPPPLELAAGGSYLADLDEFGVRRGPWPYTKDGTLGDPERRPITAGGRRFPKGLSMVPGDGPGGYAGAKFHVAGRATRLEAGIALDDTAAPHTPVTFEVWGDGRRLWQSVPVSEKAKALLCRVDLTGVEVVELRTVAGFHFGVHAVWLDPKLFPAE